MASYDSTSEQLENTADSLNSVEAEQSGEEQTPCFPHLQLNRPELDRTYPSLEAPDDFDEANCEPPEPTLQAGLKVASSIATAMKVHGRTRQDKTQQNLNSC